MRAPRLAIAALLLSLAACDTVRVKHTRFVVLDPLPAPSGETGPTARPGLTVALGPIDIPDLLDRPQVVVRKGPNRVDVDDFHHWAGSLKDNIQRVLQQDLMTLLGSDRILSAPWPLPQRPALQVTLQILRFDGTPGGRAVLKGLWSILHGKNEKLLASGRFEIEEEVQGETYADLAAAESRALARLAGTLSRALDSALEKGRR